MMEINWNKFVVLLLPLKMRTATVFGFIRSVLAPIVFLYNQFQSYYTDVLYRLQHTSQVWAIEKVLNDAFDVDLRRIYTTDAGGDVVRYIHRDSDLAPIIINQDSDGDALLIHTDSAYNASAFDFIINIPYQYTEAEIYRLKALVDYYRLAGKRYDIIVNI